MVQKLVTWKRADVTGRLSRNVGMGEFLMFLGIVDAIAAVQGVPLFSAYPWLPGVILGVSGRLQIYLRELTKTPMK